ncbi:NADPH2:quinone reductase [Cribrihabitans marinus]|uniref:NADPH2:quinone reductase n=1 Tax=Cribrihabitans marinus TaxID=1227549 RepID=A0A1H6RPK3_9RHOB|nr:NADPH:quinone reductase [Cribrihabitans marinus]GGH20940.1 alcohol dehydrogenase [Cribrihabitans marinus]SEI53535.1 NADPH2:quinone reductase [Cribrihabitans marinus]
MKAVTYDRFGPAAEVLTLDTLDDPQPAPGEVLVALAYSGVNPSDVKARAGARPGVTRPPFPRIVPHSDGAGEIVAVGDGVDAGRVGERVWIWNGQWKRAFGTAAGLIALPAAQAVALPPGTSLQTGAVLGIPGQTACHTVFSGGPVEDATVLIHGGAGTVGYLAVQLARWGGARVIATARPTAFDRVREAGADAVLDYAAPDLAERVLAANDGRPVDRIVDVEFGRNAAVNAAVIAECGRINAYGSAAVMEPVLPFYPLMFKAVTLEMALIYLLTPEQREYTCNRLRAALEQGALDCPVQQVLPLADCARAHDIVAQGGRRGAVLLDTQS